MKRIFLLFLILLSFNGFSQEKKDVKVGLVLSGGGAKGLAHIGALKVIEEAGIEIDYIGGTSMGAIIGALYASGYSANQLDSIFHQVDFDLLLQDGIPRSAKTFHEKAEAEKYALTLPFDDFKISFPSGLSKGQNIYNLISRLTLHLGNVRDFSELPIPFFTVASNIETGEQVILENGSLAKAVSASGAIPSVFSPVEIDGMLLTDGGVTNNYPVEELRNRGVDVVIGVDVQDTLMDRESLRNAFAILTQVSNFRTIRDMREKIELTDIYIKPEISNFGMLSFDKGEEIIESGAVAALENIEALREVALVQQQEERLNEKEQFSPLDKIDIRSVTIEGNNSYPRSYIIGKLRLRYDEDYSWSDLHYGINNLTATGNFDRINYSLIPNDDAYTLSLQLEESRNKTFVRLALHYDDLYKSGALVNLTRKSLFFTNDAASVDVVLGDNFRYNFQYYIDKGFYWSFGVNSRYNSFDKDISYGLLQREQINEPININLIEIDYQDYTNQIYVETLFKQVFSFGMGLEHKYLKITSQTIQNLQERSLPSAVFEKNNYYSAFGYLKLDSFDQKYFPKSGLFFNGNLQFYLFSPEHKEEFSEFSIVRGNLGYAFSPINKFTTRLSTETGFRIGNDNNSRSLDFFLGGFGNDLINNLVPFYGYDFMSITGDSYIKALVEFDYEIIKKNHLILSANFANVENNLYSTGNWLSLPDYSGYALGYGLETFLGPVQVKYSYSPEINESHWFFSLGFWF